MHLSRTNGIFSPAANFFRSLPIGTYCSLVGPRLVCGQKLWVTGGRLPSGEYLIIVSNYFSETVMDDYKRRWEIEIYQSCNLRRTLFWQKFDSVGLHTARRAVCGGEA